MMVMMLPFDEFLEGLVGQQLRVVRSDDFLNLFHLGGVDIRRSGPGLRAGDLRQAVQRLEVLRPEVHVLLGVSLNAEMIRRI